MQVYREITPVTEEDFFVIMRHEDPDFSYPIHLHPEYELNLVVNCEGERIVGDSVMAFGPEDLVFIGPNVYHSWETEFPTGAFFPDAYVITIQFSEHLFDGCWLKKSDVRSIRSLLEQSQRGIVFHGQTRDEVIKKLDRLSLMKSGFPSVLAFLDILHQLGGSPEKTYLASEGFTQKPNRSRSQRINRVYQYILEHFTRTITLAEVAAEANMSESAFSHFFKRSTNKSFTRFVIDLRLGNSAKMLLETEDNISQICYACGFNNVSNFNRLFKKHKGYTPHDYRNRFRIPPAKAPEERFVIAE